MFSFKSDVRVFQRMGIPGWRFFGAICLSGILACGGGGSSEKQNTTSDPPAVAPTFAPPAGTYASAQSVTLTSTTTGATIRYTTDGTTPIATSPTYSSPIAITTTTTLKAFAQALGYTDSSVVTATYTISAPGNTIVVDAGGGGDYTTIQAALNVALAGDIIEVRPGTYHENISFPRSGSATGGYIALVGDAGAILDGTGLGEVGITISGKSYLKIANMTVRNFTGSDTPMGIYVDGGCSHLEVRNNLIEHIENDAGNAHGIAFYGNTTTPISNLIVDGNEIRNCLLGSSESLALNGNVTDFVVSNNIVHDNDNIGIVFIGFEGTGPTDLDQARNGLCVGNTVTNITSISNPAYGGERSADGIYVDGGRDIVIERNQVDNCDIGVEVASEHGGKTASNITVRNNFVSRSYQGNILVGGYAANMGNAQNITVVNNTFCQGTDGEVVIQFNCDSIVLSNNICFANSGNDYLVQSGSNNANITVDNNLYFGASTTSPGDYPDANALFADPLLVSPYTDLHLQTNSPAANAGKNLGNDAQGNPIIGSLDIDGTPRLQGSAVDMGADEVK